MLDIDNTCEASATPGSCGTRPRTFATPIIRRGVDDTTATAAASNLSQPPDRAALAATQQVRHTRAYWQTAPTHDSRRDEAGGDDESLIIDGDVVYTQRGSNPRTSHTLDARSLPHAMCSEWSDV